jgi:hypothetical protein
MPAGTIQRSNTILYTLITFVVLFIIATVLAIICYVKAEAYKAKALTSQRQLNEIATPSQQQAIGSIVGTKQSGKSRLETLVDYLDEMVTLVLGQLPEDTSAEVKIDTVKQKTDALLNRSSDNLDKSGLVQIIEKLQKDLENAAETENVLKQQLEDLNNRFDDAMEASFEKEQVLLAEKEKYQKQIDTIMQDYDQLKSLLKETTDQQVHTLVAQVEEERDNSRELKQKLLKSQAELKMAEDKMNYIQQQLQKLVPPPDSEVSAFKADGNIILVDEQNKIVHINLGSENHIYRGLTFSVYDKNTSIPGDGKGKAEIEVFGVGENISSARIINLENKKTILPQDIIANLIWDSEKTNVFVVAGDFDVNNDGRIDDEGIDKIKALIEKWGGSTQDSITIQTDFIVLGVPPSILEKPTFEEMELDPMATEKYEASLHKFEQYKEIETRAKDLGIPILNYDRFLYLVGYKSLSTQPGTF